MSTKEKRPAKQSFSFQSRLSVSTKLCFKLSILRTIMFVITLTFSPLF